MKSGEDRSVEIEFPGAGSRRFFARGGKGNEEESQVIWSLYNENELKGPDRKVSLEVKNKALVGPYGVSRTELVEGGSSKANMGGSYFRTDYEGGLVLNGRVIGKEEKRIMRVGLEVTAYDNPHEWGHVVYGREDVKFILPEGENEIEVLGALTSPHGVFAHDCEIKVRDKDGFLARLANQGSSLGAGDNFSKAINQEVPVETNLAEHFIARVIKDCFYSPAVTA